MQKQKKEPPKPEQVFAVVLRTLRLKAGLSQERLGFESGYHRTYTGMLERGLMNPSLNTILRLSAALNVPAGNFVAQIEEKLGGVWQKPDKRIEPRKSLPEHRKGQE